MGGQALDGKRHQSFYQEPEELVIVTDRGHPLYDERAEKPLDEGLVRSVMAMGILQPIAVTKDGNQVLVVYGRQRVRAAREANRRLAEAGVDKRIQVPCAVRRGKSADHASAMVAENECRTDDDPMTKARKAQHLLDLGEDEEGVALAFGTTAQTIRRWLGLLEMADEVQDALAAGELSVAQARKLRKLDHAAQRKALAEAEPAGPGADGDGKTKPRRPRKKIVGPRRPNKTQVRMAVDSIKGSGAEVEPAWAGAAALLSWTLGEVEWAEVVAVSGDPSPLPEVEPGKKPEPPEDA